MLILTVSADGAVPLAHRLVAGNTNDDQTHIATWDELCALTDRSDFLYVADSRLCTRDQMTHIDQRARRFVTVLPRTRREDGLLRDWMATSTPEFTEAVRGPGKRDGDPDRVWKVTPAPFPSSEGHRIVWVHSSVKQYRDETARHERIDRTRSALEDLNERLAGPRTRITTKVAAQDAAAEIVNSRGAEQYVSVTVTETVQETFARKSADAPAMTPAIARSPRPADSCQRQANGQRRDGGHRRATVRLVHGRRYSFTAAKGGRGLSRSASPGQTTRSRGVTPTRLTTPSLA
ncbi:MAG: hypothetical protein ABSG43_22755 [Solirubrobacteraceae bacterium]